MDYLKEQVNKVGSRLHLLLLLLCCAACSDGLDEVSPGTPVAVSVSVGGMEGYETAATRGAETVQRFVCREEGKPALQVAITPQTATTRGDADTRALGEGIYFRLLVKNNATGALADYVDYRYTSAGVVAVEGKQLVLPVGNTYLFGAYTYNSTASITDAAALSIGDIGPGSDMRVWQSQPMLLQGPLDLPIVFRPLTSGLAVRLNTAGAGGLDALAGIDAASVTRSKATWALGLAVTSEGDDAWRTVAFNSPSSWADPTRVTSSCSPVLPQTNGTLAVYFRKLATQDIVLTDRWVTLTGVTLLPGVSYVCDITVSSEGEEAEEEVKVETLGESAETRANCYIVLPGKEYFLNAEYEGNVDTRVGTTVPGTPAGAKLVWQSAPGLIVKTGYKSGQIFIVTDNSSTQFEDKKTLGGNALVAVTDAAGIILWSWHLWVVDEATKATIEGGAGDGNRYMDRHLGAMSAHINGGPSTYGLVYQWGRKDPFVSSSSSTKDSEAYVYDSANKSTKVNMTVTKQQASRSVATMNPTLIYALEDQLSTRWASDLTVTDWSTGSSPSRKTKHDPCPSKWKVMSTSEAFVSEVYDGARPILGHIIPDKGGWYPACWKYNSMSGTQRETSLWTNEGFYVELMTSLITDVGGRMVTKSEGPYMGVDVYAKYMFFPNVARPVRCVKE